MLYSRAAPAATIPTTKNILGERILVDLIDELEFALAVIFIESTERQARTPASSTPLIIAATAVDAAIVYLRNLRS